MKRGGDEPNRILEHAKRGVSQEGARNTAMVLDDDFAGLAERTRSAPAAPGDDDNDRASRLLPDALLQAEKGSSAAVKDNNDSSGVIGKPAAEATGQAFSLLIYVRSFFVSQWSTPSLF